ncbi:unnamed protein product [Rhizophagus irregularis]|nr:unnamed protein product [Rhizophagus irregularis]
MIDKSRPTKSAIKDILRGTFLCWFHVMQTLGENFNQWAIPWQIRYPIAIAFKIIGRSRTEEQALELGSLYKSFIDKLSLSFEKKNKLKNDLFKNWICDEWRLSLIDAGRIPSDTTQHPMTTNNFTERLHRTIETQYNSIQTVVNFVERLYGMKLKCENIGRETGETYFEAGLATLFNMQSIEQENQAATLSTDKLRRLNQGRLYFLLGLVKPSQHPDYFYVKKIDKSQLLKSAYNGNLIELDDSVMNYLTPLYDKLIESHINIVPKRERYYLTRISTGKCLICYDYIWNSPFCDVLNYFKNKHRVLLAEKKNELIYNGNVETAFEEIVKYLRFKLIEYNRIIRKNIQVTKEQTKEQHINNPTKYYQNEIYSNLPMQGIHPSPFNYEYLPNISVTPCSLPINSHFREEQNLLNLHLPNGQEQQFVTPSNNYTLNSNLFTNVNINPSSNGKTNSFEYYLL